MVLRTRALTHLSEGSGTQLDFERQHATWRPRHENRDTPRHAIATPQVAPLLEGAIRRFSHEAIKKSTARPYHEPIKKEARLLASCVFLSLYTVDAIRLIRSLSGKSQ